MLLGQMNNIIRFTSNAEGYNFNIRDFIIDKKDPLGFGLYAVYKAEHIPSKRSVAIKYIPHVHLKQEIKNLTAVINCPNIVRLYGFGRENANTLIIMEKMDFSLKDYIKFAHAQRIP